MNIYEIIKNKTNIIKEKRKTLALIVHPDLTITLKAPLEAEEYNINKFIEKRTIWAFKQLEYFKQFQNKQVQSYVSGSNVKYLGRQYMLKVEKSDNDYITFNKNRFLLYTKQHDNIEYNKNILNKFMYEKAQVVFYKELINCLATFKDIKTPILKIRQLNKRWGSYLNNTITLNPALIMVDKKSIRYVITHELCHYYYKDHSKDFYALLTSKIPNWQEIKHNMELKILTYR